MFLGEKYPNELQLRNLYLSANFWFARAYATDNGGEVVRKAIEEAEQFERICVTAQERIAPKTRFESALRERGPRRATQAAIEMLENDEVLERLSAKVKASKNDLMDLTDTGHAVVYAIRVEPTWFGKYWKSNVLSWEEGRRKVDLPCCGSHIPPDRLVGKVSYPNGTDMDFLPTWFSPWQDVLALTHK